MQIKRIKEIKMSNFYQNICSLEVIGETYDNNVDILITVPKCKTDKNIEDSCLKIEPLLLDNCEYYAFVDRYETEINIPNPIEAMKYNGYYFRHQTLDKDRNKKINLNNYHNIFISKNDNGNYSISFDKENGESLQFEDVEFNNLLSFVPNLSNGVLATKTEHLTEWKED